MLSKLHKNILCIQNAHCDLTYKLWFKNVFDIFAVFEKNCLNYKFMVVYVKCTRSVLDRTFHDSPRSF